MFLPIFWEFETYGGYDRITSYTPEPSRIKKKNPNIFIKIKWFILISIWKFKNRKWKNYRKKNKALKKYKDSLTKGYWV